MCGIVGLFLKKRDLEPKLGIWFEPMLLAMSERGPDSAGFAIYRRPVEAGHAKLTVFHADEAFDWRRLAADLGAALKLEVALEVEASHAVLRISGTSDAARAWIEENHPAVRIMSAGTAIEIYKEKGAPADVARRYGLRRVEGSHAIGHTRMATESAVTTEHSHPFSTGLDLCLVHNGSLSNHNRLRTQLVRHGIRFATDNDSEVAAGYLTWRLGQGMTIGEALAASLADLDGFYTFAVGTRGGFAVLRDPIACKPAVLAETEDWVAMASEYRSLAHLPGAGAARIWEPEPGKVYSWGRA
jgi:methylamine---glutamate N-methyltransferase subunit A